jgi:hypothetical protein
LHRNLLQNNNFLMSSVRLGRVDKSVDAGIVN